MKLFRFTEARQKLATLLELAAKYGEVRIKGRDGQVFVTKPQKYTGSLRALDGLKKKLSRREILESVEDGRRSF